MAQFSIYGRKLNLTNRQVKDFANLAKSTDNQSKDTSINDALRHRTKFQKLTDFFHVTSHNTNIQDVFNQKYKDLSNVPNLTTTQRVLVTVIDTLKNGATNQLDYSNRLKIQLNPTTNKAKVVFSQNGKPQRLSENFDLQPEDDLLNKFFKTTNSSDFFTATNPNKFITYTLKTEEEIENPLQNTIIGNYTDETNDSQYFPLTSPKDVD